MKDNVFQCYSESSSKQQFTKTMEVLEGYIKKNMNFPKDIASLCKKYTLDGILDPKDLTDEEKKSDAKKLICKTHVQLYVRRTEVQENKCQNIYLVIWR